VPLAIRETGAVGDPGASRDPRTPPPDGPRGNNVPIDCTGPAVPAAVPLARFAIDGYRAALRELTGDAVDRVAPALDAMPADEPVEEGAFDRQDHRMSDQHVEGYFRVADGIATAVATDEALRTRVVGACGSAVDEACIRAFVPGFLRRAFRRTPTTAEVDAAIATALEFGGNEGVHAVVFTTLMAPDFVFRFENRGVASGETIALTAFETASRLSYHFWGEPPDAALLDAAERGELDTEAGYAAAVERLYDDPRTEAMLMEFFAQWLHLERGSFVAGPRLDVLRDGMDTEGLSEEMLAELEDLIRYHLQSEDGSWKDVLTSDLSFARTERLASIYGVDVWDGSSTPPSLPAGERSGLLTRAGMLYTSDGSTNPFRRGVFVRRTILCDAVAPPPSDLPPDALEPPPPEAGASTRTSFEAKVANEPCRTCHAQFAPLGYALEAYDGLGRFRTTERLIDSLGADLGTATVDASVTPRIEIDDERPTENPVELSARIAESAKPNVCLARRYFRFTYRHDETSADVCTVGSLAARLEEGEPLRSALRSVALDPSFRVRRLED
jgi:hypothetical protein